jgi:hypothetical protein
MTKRQAKQIFRLLRQISKITGESGGTSLRAIGQRWEKKFSKSASELGFDVLRLGGGRAIPYDLIVNGLKVQCKIRETSSVRPVKLRLHAAAGETKEAYLAGDFDVLALRCNKQTYIIPASELVSPDDRFLINMIRPSDYARYIDNWDAFRGCGARRDARQTSLGFMLEARA